MPPWDGGLKPGSTCDPAALDPSMYAQYTQQNVAPNGLPQESKLATYMNRSTAAQSQPLNQALANLSIDSPPQNIKKQVIINEFVPMSYYQPGIIPESADNTSQAAPMAAHMPMPGTSQIHQENVGGTTYFYPTSSDNMNAPNFGASGSMGPDVMAGAMGPHGTSPYATQMYAAPPQHLQGPINLNPVPTWQPLPVPNVVPIQMGYHGLQPCACNEAGCPGYVSPQFQPPPANFSPVFSPRRDFHLRPYVNPADFTQSLAPTFYQPETIKEEIYERTNDIYLQADQYQYPDLPKNVEMYSDLVPLESHSPLALTTTFRATHRQTGEYFILRRLHFLYPSISPERLDMWKLVDHSNVVKFYECFTTQAFDDISTVAVYTYHPGSETLLNKYFSGDAMNSAADQNSFIDPFSSDPDAPRPYTHQKNTMLRAVACGVLLPEAVLWNLLVQLTAGLRAIHAAGLACRGLDANKVIVSGARVRIAWGGLAFATFPFNEESNMMQQEDLTALGQLMLALACRKIHCDNINTSMEIVSSTYSTDFNNVIGYLLSNTSQRSLADLMPMIGARYYTQIDALQRRTDVLEDLLSYEIDNSRLLRILVKLGVVNERPELNMDGSWSETGNRYMLKLFRDRLFHSVTPDGLPWIDMAHITNTLNSLDAGIEEMVDLMSRDEQSVLVVTYAELKHCLESAFEEVTGASSSL